MRSNVVKQHSSRSHLSGVIVENTDGVELGPDAAALCEGRAAVFVRALLKPVGNGDIFDGRGPGFNFHLWQETRVHKQAHDCHNQAQQEDNY